MSLLGCRMSHMYETFSKTTILTTKNQKNMEEIVIPIFVCVVLPISIVLIISLRKMNRDNKRTQIIIRAIEANKDIDTEKLIESLQTQIRKPTALEILNARLLRGCMYSLIGVILAIFGIVSLTLGYKFDSEAVTISFLFGGVSLAIGISYLIVYFVTRKQVEITEVE